MSLYVSMSETLSLRTGASECFLGGRRTAASAAAPPPHVGTPDAAPASELLPAEAPALGAAAASVLEAADARGAVESTCMLSGCLIGAAPPDAALCCRPANPMRCRDSWAAARGTNGETSGCVFQKPHCAIVQSCSCYSYQRLTVAVVAPLRSTRSLSVLLSYRCTERLLGKLRPSLQAKRAALIADFVIQAPTHQPLWDGGLEITTFAPKR